VADDDDDDDENSNILSRDGVTIDGVWIGNQIY
jgi:hypothetical protein